MASSNEKLNQALADLIGAFSDLEEQLEDKYGDDEDAYTSSLIEAVEASIETALDEQGSTTPAMASMLSALTEALEELDPAAFDELEEEELEGDDYDLDDVSIDDYDDDDVDLD